MSCIPAAEFFVLHLTALTNEPRCNLTCFCFHYWPLDVVTAINLQELANKKQ